MSEATSNAYGRITRGRGTAGLVATLLISSLLPGCPLSDKYYIDPNAGIAGTRGAETGHISGSGVIAGKSGIDASSGSGRVTGGSGGMAGADMAPGSGGAGGTMPVCVPEPERCDGISNDCDGEVDEGSVCPAGCTAKRYDGHLYLFCVSDNANHALDANDASTRCADLGVQLQLELSFGLVWIESSAENEFLKNWIKASAPTDGAVWTAANDDGSEGKWVWGRRTTAEQFFTGNSSGDGSPYLDRFNDFAPGQPDGAARDDEDCGAFDSAFGWRWADEFCTTLLPGFICEEHPLE